MILIEKTDVVGLEAAIRGMRNPMNSWDRSDSVFNYDDKEFSRIGTNDLKLMEQLADRGSVHAKYRRMIVVYLDITAPLYWWKEFDTYKVGTVANSCSTMHKIHEKEFTLEDFSYEHLFSVEDIPENSIDNYNILAAVDVDGDTRYFLSKGYMQMTCEILNHYREKYLETEDKKYWWQMIQLLPSSYNQKRTVMLNYEVLHNIYKNRRNHKLDEWRQLCKWIETLPLSHLILCFPGSSSFSKGSRANES